MQSIALNNENGDKLLKGDRPNLSINTDLPRKKKSWHLFSARHKSRFSPDSNGKPSPFSPKLLKRSSLPIPSPTSPALHHQHTTISLKHIKNAISPMLSTSNISHEMLTDDDKSDKHMKSADSTSIHSASSVKNPLRKFHLPNFSKRSNSQYSSAISEYRVHTPTAPEPIMPTLVDWSPEAPVSPPPWELSSNDEEAPYKGDKRHSLGFHNFTSPSLRYDGEAEVDSDEVDVNTTEYHSDSEIDRTNNVNISPSSTITDSSDFTLTASSMTAVSSHSTYDGSTRLRRRSSCPTYDTLSMRSSSTVSSSRTLVENDIIAITEQHTRYMSVFKKNTQPTEKKPAFKPCQKVKARAAEAAANGEAVHLSNSIYSSFCEESLKYRYVPNVFDPVTHEPVLEFSAIKPRKYELYRKTSWKREAKALLTWHHLLEEKLRDPTPVHRLTKKMPSDKVERYLLTRRFILREFFMTEVNFWNQLYYSKVVFYDSLIYSLEKESPFTKPSDVDVFGNLFDLMQFSAKLINRLRHFQLGSGRDVPPLPSVVDDKSDESCQNVNCNNLHLGKAIVDMAEDFVVFLRCAVDYKDNRKHLDNKEHNEGFVVFNQRLNSRKETSQFSMKDYLIIPIQRVARYGLLIADLLKHTEPNHPDFENLTRALQIVTSLASAMNSAQKGQKKKKISP